MKIISATYGGVNCTKELQSLVHDNMLCVRASNSIIGDPCVGTIKYLSVEVEVESFKLKDTVKEGDLLVLPKTNLKRLGVFYSNNNNPSIYKAISKSLATIEHAALGKADIITNVWNSIPDNPFPQVISWYNSSSHLTQLLQIMQCLYFAREIANYDYVSFLEHDVMYPEGYFDYGDFSSGNVLINMNYGGLCPLGWQQRKQDDEPFHQMTMVFNDAIKHCETILANAIVTNSGNIEPNTLKRVQWQSLNQCIHINHGMHFTSHNSIYDKQCTTAQHEYWGDYHEYLNLFPN